MFGIEWLSDERLYYGGMAFALIAAVVILVYFITSRIAISHLKKQFDREYGEKMHIRR